MTNRSAEILTMGGRPPRSPDAPDTIRDGMPTTPPARAHVSRPNGTSTDYAYMEIGEKIIEDPSSWIRAGRGREVQFFATDGEVKRWLTDFLPAKWAPWEIIQVGLQQGDDAGWSEAWRIVSPSECFNHSGVGTDTCTDLWLRAKALTPKLDLGVLKSPGRALATSGLILLQHGRSTSRNGKLVSRFAIVDKIRNINTNEICRYRGYRSAFDHLRRKVLVELPYTTMHAFADGTESEVDYQRMTTGAVREYQAGVKMSARPGRLISHGLSEEEK